MKSFLEQNGYKIDPNGLSIWLTEFVQTRNVTVVRLELHTNEGIFVGTGDSHRHSVDEPSEVIGENLALERALRSLADGIGRRTQGLIKHAEDTAIQKAAQKAKKLAAKPKRVRKATG